MTTPDPMQAEIAEALMIAFCGGLALWGVALVIALRLHLRAHRREKRMLEKFAGLRKRRPF